MDKATDEAAATPALLYVRLQGLVEKTGCLLAQSLNVLYMYIYMLLLSLYATSLALERVGRLNTSPKLKRKGKYIHKKTN